MDNSEIIKMVLLFFGGSGFATIIGYFFLRPKTRAEAAAKRAEGDHVDVGSQAEIIESWRKHSKDLEERLTRAEGRLDSADRREHDIALLVFQMSMWQQRAYLLLTDDQRGQTGEPPKVDPAFFSGLRQNTNQ